MIPPHRNTTTATTYMLQKVTPYNNTIHMLSRFIGSQTSLSQRRRQRLHDAYNVRTVDKRNAVWSFFDNQDKRPFERVS